MAESGELTENKLVSLAEAVVDPKVWPHIPRFLATATKNEIKGLKVVASIYKHQGKKKFRPRPYPSVNNTEDLLKNKIMRSYYNSEYCQVAGPETDIFKYKKISELKCSEMLNKNCLESVQNWLSLKDNPCYQDLLLVFLRGVYSVYKSQEAVPNSSHRENYAWNRVEPKSQSPLKDIVRKVQLESEKTSNKRSESTKIAPIPKRREIVNESPKSKALKHLKGSGEITSWIANVHTKNTSIYQDSFLPTYSIKQPTSKNDFHTSTIFKLLP